MAITSIKLVIIILSLPGMLFSSYSSAGNSVSEKDRLLFKISRSRDADEIWYTVNLTENGKLDENEPIKIFWVRVTKNNKTAPLTWLQYKYSYGIHVTIPYDKISGNLKFQFVSYSQQTFELRKSGDESFRVYTTIENREIEVIRIFVQIDGGSFWLPSVPYVEVIGYDVLSSDLVVQTIIP
jgi:hypothetical protein